MKIENIAEAIAAYIRKDMTLVQREAFLMSLSSENISDAKTAVVNTFIIIARSYTFTTGREFPSKLDPDLFDKLVTQLRSIFQKEIDDLPVVFTA